MWQLPGPQGAGRATSKWCPANKKRGAVLTSASGGDAAAPRGGAWPDAVARARASVGRGRARVRR